MLFKKKKKKKKSVILYIQLCLDLRLSKSLKPQKLYKSCFEDLWVNRRLLWESSALLKILGKFRRDKILWLKPKYYPGMTLNGISGLSGCSYGSLHWWKTTSSGFGEDFYRPPVILQAVVDFDCKLVCQNSNCSLLWFKTVVPFLINQLRLHYWSSGFFLSCSSLSLPKYTIGMLATPMLGEKLKQALQLLKKCEQSLVISILCLLVQHFMVSGSWAS